MYPLGIILDILIWRRRKFANLIIYYEQLSAVIGMFTPHAYGEFDLFIISMWWFMIYMASVVKVG